MKNYLIYLIAFCSGAAGVLAFSPFDWWGMAYLSLTALIALIKTTPKKTALLAAFLWGMGLFSVGVSWLHVSIHQFGGAPILVSYLLVLLLAAYLSLYPLLFAYLVRRFNVGSLVMYPVLWTLTEFLRGWVFTGFPWLQFGYTQIDGPFAGIAPIFGVSGLTFFVMWASAALFSIFSALWRRPRKFNIALAHVFLLLIVGGLSAYSSHKVYVESREDKALTITLAQGNIEQNLKWDPDYLYRTLAIYQGLIERNLGTSDLIILPESALPALENQIQPYFFALQQAAAEKGSELIIGSVYHNIASDRLLNSIVVVGDPQQPYQQESANRYSKHHLVPFGEYVPLESLLRPLGSVFNLPMSAFQAGNEIQAPLQAKGRAFSAAICYEIILGAQLRNNLTTATDFILTVSNDAWFGDSIGPWQHLQMARMRALELGKPVIRATNTGISAFIDARGKILTKAPQFMETALTYKLAPTQGKTPYAALGDTPLYLLMLMFTLLKSAAALIRKSLLKNGG
ncbi:apolipoprotein N-acyltransferase [Mesocricetibacter intestinalis]|uniref:Apolipoprotein N-acyltransferase n=1 Tax=Mesocricetibacter intestinalis TaxID=1521930 RepID=A0A4V3D9M8_9PAST|nr:apolipoprotein N-acyltransferase [Mesocricetibacter intestinalis]TDQ57937.1 apolipoprotein N-acyltransferase [Mesocricetibacter intestinalis]